MASEKDVPVVNVGEKIKFQWSEEGGKTRTIHASVTGVEKSSKRKHGSYYKYELCLYKENNAPFSTRLINLPWEKKESGKRKESTNDEEVSQKHKKPKITACVPQTISAVPRTIGALSKALTSFPAVDLGYIRPTSHPLPSLG